MFEFTKQEFTEQSKIVENIEYKINLEYNNSNQDYLIIAESEQGNYYENIDEIEQEFRNLHEIRFERDTLINLFQPQCEFILNALDSLPFSKKIENFIEDKIIYLKNYFFDNKKKEEFPSSFIRVNSSSEVIGILSLYNTLSFYFTEEKGKIKNLNSN